MSDAFERLVREVREDLGKQPVQRVDWERVDRGLFDRIDRERRTELSQDEGQSRIPWTLFAIGFAVALAAALVVGKTHEQQALDVMQSSAEERAGNLVAIEGAGDVLVDGKAAGVGGVLRLGDVIESRGAQVTVERPGKVVFVVEPGSRVTVHQVRGALVLALAAGTVEAQVVPVARGEAFAVDVGRSRIAVHGTHLRVARAGDRVVVDLSAGVISVGEAPRVGSTFGALVTAPAHAEFVADDAEGTLAVTHDALAVRPPLPREGFAPGNLGGNTTPALTDLAAPSSESAESRAGAAASTALQTRPEPRPAAAASSSQGAGGDPSAELALAAAVRACLAERPIAENVTISVSTTLYLVLRDDGSVHSARFDPPVAPDVNACAAHSIYKTRFTRGGDVAIGVDFKVPSSTP